jgi:hypothetical protein
VIALSVLLGARNRTCLTSLLTFGDVSRPSVDTVIIKRRQCSPCGIVERAGGVLPADKIERLGRLMLASSVRKPGGTYADHFAADAGVRGALRVCLRAGSLATA